MEKRPLSGCSSSKYELWIPWNACHLCDYLYPSVSRITRQVVNFLKMFCNTVQFYAQTELKLVKIFIDIDAIFTDNWVTVEYEN